jgi:glycosyltransferase involved in cell wall biosynthesis
MIHGHDTQAAVRLAEHPPALVVHNSAATAAQAHWGGPQVIVRPPVHPDRYRTTPGDRATLVNLSIPKGGALFDLLARSLPGTQFLAVKGGYGAQMARTLPNVEHVACTPNMRDDVYARTRVLLMPSASESWGRVGVEAMCSGIPVIAHPTPGLVESLAGAGVFVDRSDLGGWRRELQRLDDPGEWAAASERALARAAELDPAPDLQRFEAALQKVVSCA